MNKCEPKNKHASGRVDHLVVPFNKLTPAEVERLSLLLEELGEAQQVIGKILRHGYESYNRHDVNRETNRKLLERELGDVEAALKIMLRNNDLSISEIKYYAKFKIEKVNKYLHHNEA